MKIKRINRHDIKRLNDSISEEAKRILATDGVRLSLIYAFLFLILSADAGFLFSSLILEFFELCSITVSEVPANILTIMFILLFAAPAAAGIRSLAASACDGNPDRGELFVAFSSPERFFSSYLGFFTICLRYALVCLILYIPDMVMEYFDGGGELDPIAIPISFAATLLALALWYLLTARLGKLSFYLWSRRMPYLRALRESYKGGFVSLGITGRNILKGLLTIATLFILLIFHTGPLWVLESEVSMRQREDLLKKLSMEKLRKDGQDK